MPFPMPQDLIYFSEEQAKVLMMYAYERGLQTLLNKTNTKQTLEDFQSARSWLETYCDGEGHLNYQWILEQKT